MDVYDNNLRVVAKSPEGVRITDTQVERIIKHFGEHATLAYGLVYDFDRFEEILTLSAYPARGVTVQDAEQALKDAIAAAMYIHQDEQLDLPA